MDANVFANSKHAALEQRDELTLLRIDNAHAAALIALQGAQVLEYCAKGQKPLIWLSELAEFKRDQSIRGGIPVCWPWFGDIKRNPDNVRNMTRGDNLPAHGLVRAQSWVIESIREQRDATQVILSYSTMASTQPEWPHDATVKLTISIGAKLGLQLSTRNDSKSSIHISQALHAYFPVSDIREVAINGFEQARYIDTLDAWREHPQNGAIEFAGETDRIYLDVPEQVDLLDRGGQRRIFLRTRNSSSAIVWNPWIDKARRLSQFADDAWQHMLCIETANVLSDSVALVPGEQRSMDVELWS